MAGEEEDNLATTLREALSMLERPEVGFARDFVLQPKNSSVDARYVIVTHALERTTAGEARNEDRAETLAMRNRCQPRRPMLPGRSLWHARTGRVGLMVSDNASVS